MKKVSFEMFNTVIRQQFGEYPSETEIRGWYDAIEVPEILENDCELRTPHSALLVPRESAVIPTGIESEEMVILEPVEGTMIKNVLQKGHIVIQIMNVNEKAALDLSTGDVIARAVLLRSIDQ